MHLHKRLRLTQLKDKLCKTGHYESAKGSDEQNKDYCQNDGDLLLEVGRPAAKAGTNASYTTASELTQRVVFGESIGKLISENDDYKAAFFKHSRSIQDTVDELKQHHNAASRYEDMLDLNLVFYPWQVELYTMLTTQEPHDRQIYWYFDYHGMAGKSTFVDYYKARHRAKKITGGKINDLCYSYDYEPVVFFDFARGKETTYLNAFIEDLKNGFLFSAKYKSFDKIFRRPHVIILSNRLPDPDSFSKDRLVLKNITNPLHYVPPQTSLPAPATEVPAVSEDVQKEKDRIPSSSTVPPP